METHLTYGICAVAFTFEKSYLVGHNFEHHNYKWFITRLIVLRKEDNIDPLAQWIQNSEYRLVCIPLKGRHWSMCDIKAHDIKVNLVVTETIQYLKVSVAGTYKTQYKHNTLPKALTHIILNNINDFVYTDHDVHDGGVCRIHSEVHLSHANG